MMQSFPAVDAPFASNTHMRSPRICAEHAGHNNPARETNGRMAYDSTRGQALPM